MSDDSSCVLCGAPQETMVHALRDCHLAYAVWMKLLSREMVCQFFELNSSEWLRTGLLGQFCLGEVADNSAVFFWGFVLAFVES